MKIVKSLEMLKFRLNLRKTLQKESYDLLIITKEELQREFNRKAKNKK